MFGHLGTAERASHALHPYPARLLRHIPAFFVSAPQVVGPSSTILDPFCGSGTTMLEARIAGHQAIGADLNPLACLISRVKTRPLDAAKARGVLDAVLDAGADGPEPARRHDRLARWFSPRVLSDLARLLEPIAAVGEPAVKDLLLVALSSVSRDVSLADPRVSVPVQLKPERYAEHHWLREKSETRLARLETVDVMDSFRTAAIAAISRVSDLTSLFEGETLVVEADARDLVGVVEDGRADCVITSPPYLGAQKYVRASSLNLLSIDLVDDPRLKELMRASVGREFFRKAEYKEAVSSGLPAADDVISRCRGGNPMRAHLAATYLNDMRSVLLETYRTLKPGGVLVLVAGPNELCGHAFPTPTFLDQIATGIGFRAELRLVNTIRSRGLMTTRNRSANVIEHESVTVMRK